MIGAVREPIVIDKQQGPSSDQVAATTLSSEGRASDLGEEILISLQHETRKWSACAVGIRHEFGVTVGIGATCLDRIFSRVHVCADPSRRSITLPWGQSLKIRTHVRLIIERDEAMERAREEACIVSKLVGRD